MNRSHPRNDYFPLYQESYEHDSCGVGLVVAIDGAPSRRIVELALDGLVDLTHRGGVGADERTGDGAGLLTQIPHVLFAPVLARFGTPAVPGDYGVATVFLPNRVEDAATAKRALEHAASEFDLPVLGWRAVPIDSSCRSHCRRYAAHDRTALPGMSFRRQRKRFRAVAHAHAQRRRRALAHSALPDVYVVSCSCRTIVYKGFCLPEDLAAFYLDLQQPDYTSAIGLFHQRYSTNTLPTWAMAQPFRFIAHNGEIDTIQGNRAWMTARAPGLRYGDDIGPDLLEPVVNLTGSDSASFDNVVELLHHGGRSLPHALMMMVPEPWEKLPDMPADLRAFYDVHAGLMEQWDGPAAIAFSDGVLAGATLDRNGLRPMRYAITTDGLFIAGSEAGTVQVDQRTIIEKGRLGPGQMVVVDTARKIVLRNPRSKPRSRPKALAAMDRRASHQLPNDSDRYSATLSTIWPPFSVLWLFGRDARLIVGPMAGEGKEPTGRWATMPRCGAFRTSPAADGLFPAAIRAGHQPTHRFFARKEGHGAR